MKFKIRGVISAARISLSPFSSGKIMRNPSLTDHLLKAQQQLRIHFKHNNCFVFRLCDINVIFQVVTEQEQEASRGALTSRVKTTYLHTHRRCDLKTQNDRSEL